MGMTEEEVKKLFRKMMEEESDLQSAAPELDLENYAKKVEVKTMMDNMDALWTKTHVGVNEKMDKIEKDMEKMDEDVKQMNEKMKGVETKEEYKEKGGRHGLTTKRSFSNLPSYDGRHELYDDWKFKMKTFLNEEKDMKELMVVLEAVREIPTKEDVEGIFDKVDDELVKNCEAKINRNWANQQMYQILCMNLQGKALSSIKNLNEEKLKDVNGIIGWCKLAQECTAMTAQRLQGLAGKVYSPRRCKKFNEVMGAIEDWELQVKLFETTEKRELSEQTKIYSVRQLVPEELERDITRASTSMTDYATVRAYITEQVTIRRDVKNETKGPVQMDLEQMKKTLASLMNEGTEEKGENDEVTEECQECDESAEGLLNQLFSFVKGGKGGKGFGGKGKKGGGGKFEGNCHHCGKPGHMIRDCWQKDEEMAAKGKGGGKGTKGFGGKGEGGGTYGKGGYGKGYGKGGYGKGGYSKGYGKAYHMEDAYGEAIKRAEGNAWTLSLRKMIGQEPEEPPGLKRSYTSNTMWKGLEKEDEGEEENDEEQKKKDLKEMEDAWKTVFPKAQMLNYSKNKLRELKGEKKIRFEPMRKSENKPLSLSMFCKDTKKELKIEKDNVEKIKEFSLNLFFKEQPMKELNPAISVQKEYKGWTKVKGVMDSGASESVAHPSMCPDYPVVESVGSAAGQKYVSASGDIIENLGQQVLEVMTEDGYETQAKYQSADVQRPLNSISEICDAGGEEGQYVVFSKWGGVVLNPDNGRRIPFDREEGIYNLTMWVKDYEKNASGFTRHGA